MKILLLSFLAILAQPLFASDGLNGLFYKGDGLGVSQYLELNNDKYRFVWLSDVGTVSESIGTFVIEKDRIYFTEIESLQTSINPKMKMLILKEAPEGLILIERNQKKDYRVFESEGEDGARWIMGRMFYQPSDQDFEKIKDLARRWK